MTFRKVKFMIIKSIGCETEVDFHKEEVHPLEVDCDKYLFHQIHFRSNSCNT